MNYLIFKSLHIIAVVTWFAGLFYMPRLFIYFAEAAHKPVAEKSILQNQFKIMQRRLWFGITWPSSIAVLIFGGALLSQFFPITNHPWLVVKLSLVAALYGYQFFLHSIYNKQQVDLSPYSSMALRVINELATFLLVSIVFLVVMKQVLSPLWGVLGLLIFIVLVLVAIKIYQRIRLAANK